MKTWKNFSDGLDQYKEQVDANSDLVETVGENSEDFIKRLKGELEGTKAFTLNDDVKNLLLHTEGTKSLDKLPFDKMFIDTNLDVEDMNEKQFGCTITRITGIVVVKATEFICSMMDSKVAPEDEEIQKTKGDGFIIYVMAWDDKNGVAFNTFQIMNRQDIFIDNSGTHLVGGIRTMTNELRNYTINFVSNFINLINNPTDIEYITKEYSKGKNKQRMRQGKMMVPGSSVICPVGDLRRYISDLHSQGTIDYSHKFWVRGHWRTLKDEQRYKNAVGKRMWIKPFIKGKGILIEKKYDVRLKEKEDE